MGEVKDIQSLWHNWETTVLEYGLDHEKVDKLCYRIESLEASSVPAFESEEEHGFSMEKAHKLLDQICNKKRNQTKRGAFNHSSPGNRKLPTAFGAIYECRVIVRGVERLLEKQQALGDKSQAQLQALKLKDGYYHINYFPGVQPSASDWVNARNKNVEKVDIAVVEKFVAACKQTGMNKRGWKKRVNEQFDISRQEFTKWLVRYFPFFGLPVPIERRSK